MSANAPVRRAALGASGEIDAFVRQAKAVAAAKAAGAGRLILALDATMSRQPTWDLACTLQAEMFDAVGKAGSLSVQLVYFRGLGECQASKFVTDTGGAEAADGAASTAAAAIPRSARCWRMP